MNLLDKANEFVAQAQVNQDYRHQFHLMPPVGWLNDPNGFVYFQGAYHLFYQFHPYDSVWGPMYWGHAKSKDLIHWENLPVALAPDQDYDRDGCFSGSAIVKDNQLCLMYTGHVETSAGVQQTQCLATSEDGITFTKAGENPVITQEQIPVGASQHDFRDPKVFQRGQKYYVVIGSQTNMGRGQVLLYQSIDLSTWQFVSVLLEGQPNQGIMWECPDFFHLDGQDVLLVSPIEMPSQGHRFNNLSSAVAFIGQMDWQTGQLTPSVIQEIDSGTDFYAPQTCLDGHNQRVMVAWLQMWQRNIPSHDLGHGWAGSMTLPRVLRIKQGQLQQTIPDKLFINFTEREPYQNLLVNQKGLIFSDFTAEQQVISLQLDLSQNFQEISFIYGAERSEQLKFSIDSKQHLLIFDRSKMGWAITGRDPLDCNVRHFEIPTDLERLSLTLVRDTASVELFINEVGVLSFTIYPKEEINTFKIFADQEVKIDQLINYRGFK